MKTFAFLLLALAIPTASAAKGTCGANFDCSKEATNTQPKPEGTVTADPTGTPAECCEAPTAAGTCGDDFNCSDEATNKQPKPEDTVTAGTPGTPSECCEARTAGGKILELKLMENFVLILKNATLTDTLSGTGPFTVFVPNEEAFQDFQELIGAAEFAMLFTPAGRGNLIDVLQNHIADGMFSDLTDGQKISTRQDEAVITRTANIFKINNASIIESNVSASNGVVHVIDAVLLPDYVSSSSAGASPTKIAVITLFAAAVQFFGPQ